MLLTRLIPEAWRPYAKTVVAFVIGLIGVLVSTLIIDDKTGTEITQAISSLAMLLGVYEAANVPAGYSPPGRPSDETTYSTRGR